MVVKTDKLKTVIQVFEPAKQEWFIVNDSFAQNLAGQHVTVAVRLTDNVSLQKMWKLDHLPEVDTGLKLLGKRHIWCADTKSDTYIHHSCYFKWKSLYGSFCLLFETYCDHRVYTNVFMCEFNRRSMTRNWGSPVNNCKWRQGRKTEVSLYSWIETALRAFPRLPACWTG